MFGAFVVGVSRECDRLKQPKLPPLLLSAVSVVIIMVYVCTVCACVCACMHVKIEYSCVIVYVLHACVCSDHPACVWPARPCFLMSLHYQTSRHAAQSSRLSGSCTSDLACSTVSCGTQIPDPSINTCEWQLSSWIHVAQV